MTARPDLSDLKHAPPPRRTDDLAVGRCPVCEGLTRRRYGADQPGTCRTGYAVCKPAGGAQ